MSEEINLDQIISFDDDDFQLIDDDDFSFEEKKETDPIEDDKETSEEEEIVEVIPPEEDPIVDDSDQLKSLFTVLKESELIKVPDDFEFKNKESFDAALDYTFEDLQSKAQTSLLEKFEGEDRLALRFALQGSGSLRDYYEQAKQVTGWADLDIDSEETQEFVVSQYLKQTTRYNDAKIAGVIEDMKNSGKLEKEAKENILELITLEEEYLQEEEKKLQEREIQLRQQKETERKEVEKIVDNLSIEPERKSKLKGFINNEMNVRKGHPSTNHFLYTLRLIGQNREHMIQLADILLDYNPEKGLTLDSIKKSATTKAASNIKEKLDAISLSPSQTSTPQTNPKSNQFDWDK
jgi:hypothetical protein